MEDKYKIVAGEGLFMTAKNVIGHYMDYPKIYTDDCFNEKLDAYSKEEAESIVKNYPNQLLLNFLLPDLRSTTLKTGPLKIVKMTE